MTQERDSKRRKKLSGKMGGGHIPKGTGNEKDRSVGGSECGHHGRENDRKGLPDRQEKNR